MGTKQRVGNRFHLLFYCFLRIFFSDGGRTFAGLFSCGILKCRFALLFHVLFLDLLRTGHAPMRMGRRHLLAYIFLCILYTVPLILLLTSPIHPHGEKVLPIEALVREQVTGVHCCSLLIARHLCARLATGPPYLHHQ